VIGPTSIPVTFVTVAVLLYFLALDTLVGASVLAVNATLRATPPHRELLRRLRRTLPLSVLATALFGAAAFVVLRATHGPSFAPAPGFGARGTIPRLLHVLLAAVAVSGLTVACLARRLEPADVALRSWIARHGAVWSTLATAGNMLVGVVWMMRLPHDTAIRFMGADTGAMLTFSLAIVAGILALGFIAMSLTVGNPRGYLDAAAVTLFVAVVAMVRMRELLRPAVGQGGADGATMALAAACALMVGGSCALVQAWWKFASPP